MFKSALEDHGSVACIFQFALRYTHELLGNRLISKCSLNLPDVFLLFKCDYVMAKEPILHDIQSPKQM